MSPESLQERRRPSGQTVADELRRRLNVLIAMQVVMTLALGGVVWYFANQATTAKDALCNLRSDQIVRIRTSQDFLVAHPHGIPGISPKVIKQGIQQASRVVDALDELGCPSVPLHTATGTH